MSFTSLNPRPGQYQLPPMRFVRFDPAPSGEAAIMVTFETTSPSDPNTAMTIAIPLPLLDAAGMLNGLKKLQSAGKIPFVPEANQSKN